MSKVNFFARRFVVGTDLQDAISEVTKLHREDIFTTLDILGEDVKTEETARQSALLYEPLIKFVGAFPHLVSNISLKATLLGLDISQNLARELLKNILSLAKHHDVFVRIDMEGSNYTKPTLELFHWARDRFDNVGIVLQAYLYRTENDLTKIMNIGGRVRLCKGAYKESADIAFQEMSDIRANFLKLAKNMLEKSDYPAFATHDDYLIKEIKKMAVAMKRNKDTFEFQMLYGLRRKTWRNLVNEGYHIRIYVPYGQYWFPFFYRRLRERKENLAFVIKNLFKR